MRRITGTFVTHLPPAADHSALVEWQALVAGVLALVPAVVIWLQLREQRRQNELLRQQIADDRGRVAAEREAKLRGWRATLPSILSKIVEYSSSVAKALHREWPAAYRMYPAENDVQRVQRLGGPVAVRLDLPTFPPRFVEPLRMIVEYSPDEAIGHRVSSIFREAQILDACIREFGAGVERPLHHSSLIAPTISSRNPASFSRIQRETISCRTARC